MKVISAPKLLATDGNAMPFNHVIILVAMILTAFLGGQYMSKGNGSKMSLDPQVVELVEAQTLALNDLVQTLRLSNDITTAQSAQVYDIMDSLSTISHTLAAANEMAGLDPLLAEPIEKE